MGELPRKWVWAELLSHTAPSSFDARSPNMERSVSTDPIAPVGFFERIGKYRFRPTRHAQGAWNAEEQHFSSLADLIAHVLLPGPG